MPSSSVRTFTEPYEYAAAIRAATIEMAVKERGHFHGETHPDRFPSRLDAALFREHVADLALFLRDRTRGHYIPHATWAKLPPERRGHRAKHDYSTSRGRGGFSAFIWSRFLGVRYRSLCRT